MHRPAGEVSEMLAEARSVEKEGGRLGTKSMVGPAEPVEYESRPGTM